MAASSVVNTYDEVGNISGAEYNFDNKYYKLLKETSASQLQTICVFESDEAIAIIAGENMEVLTKTIGYPTFLDMPANKQSELMAILPKLGNALKEAAGATHVDINCKGASDHPVFTLEPFGGSTFDKEKVVAAMVPPRQFDGAAWRQTTVGTGACGRRVGPYGKVTMVCRRPAAHRYRCSCEPDEPQQ